MALDAPIEFVLDDLQYFREHSAKGKWRDREFDKWAKTVGLKGLSSAATAKPLSRCRLKAMAKETGTFTNLEVLWAILCWGGMRRNHARPLQHPGQRSNLQALEEIINDLRHVRLNRMDAYSVFSSTIKDRGIKGLGPAFFTKLIFFASPRHDGYIMDQWTARSINLLCRDPFIKITSGGWVKPNNTPEIYERFCQAVELLAGPCDTDNERAAAFEKIEMCLFGTGGRPGKACKWRKYVRRLR